MSKAPSLVSGCNGRPEAYQAGRQVQCCRCESRIKKDANAVRIPTRKGVYLTKQIYCVSCFAAIIKQTRLELSELEQTLLSAAVI
jgi:hypothetical protein